MDALVTVLNTQTDDTPVVDAPRVDLLEKLRQRDPAVTQKLHPSVCSKVLTVRHTQNKRSKKGKGKGKGKYHNTAHDVVGTTRSILPDEVDVELPFTYTWALANNGFQYATYQFVANGMYDPDPNVGGTSFTGLAEWGTLYKKYRPLSYKWKVMASNKEDQPLKLYCWNSTTLQGGSIGTNAVYYASNAFGRIAQMGPLTGGNESTVAKGYVPISQLYGTDTVDTDDAFSADTQASDPTNKCYLGIATAGSVAQTAEGTFVTVIIHARVRFYGRFLAMP